MSFFSALKLNQRLWLLVSVFSLGLLIYGGYSFKVLTDLKVNGQLYQRIVQGKDLVADILPPPEYVVEPYLVLMQLANTSDKAKRDKLIAEFDALKLSYEQRKQYWQKQTLEPKMRVAFQQVHDTGDSFFSTATKEFIPAVQQSDATLITTALGKIEVAFNWHKNAVTGLVDLVNKRALDDESLAKQSVSEASGLLLTVLLLTVGVGLSLAYVLIRAVLKQLGGDPTYAAEAVKQVAQGNFFSNLILQPGDNSSLIYDLKNLQKTVYEFMQALTEMTDRHANGWIWDTMEPKQFSGSFADMATGINNLVRSHIDVKMQIVDVITQYSHGNFSVDMPRLPGEKAKITQAIDDVKQSLLDISTEISMLTEHGCQGDFSQRSDTSRFTYLFKEILEDINLFVETCDSGFGDVERVTIAMAKGDLTQTITRDYPGKFGSVKASVNNTIENLREMVGNVKQASDLIYTAAKEIASGNNDLSHRTEQQAASLEETAASMEQLTSTVQLNTENARQANRLAIGASEIAGKGVVVVDEVVTTMTSIHESSNKIVDIIAVIDSIAFQTNILALNAAVEAARAGDQGRGFAVVAGEVRNLAQRAAAAAGEIKLLIGDSEEKVEQGTKLVTQAGATMKEIVSAIQRVTSIMSQIASASVEQSSGIAQVNQAINQMDDVTQQNAALVEQAAAAAESLEEQAQQLADTLSLFRLSSSFTRELKTYAPATTRAPTPVKNAVVPVKKIPVEHLEGINQGLDVAIHKHSEWKVKFRSAIIHHEHLDVEKISKDNCCDFGKWLYSPIREQLGHLDTFQACLEKHAEFHTEAAKVAAAINEQNFDAANEMLHGDSSRFVSASSAVGAAIMRLKRDVALAASPTPSTPPVKKELVTSASDDDWVEF